MLAKSIRVFIEFKSIYFDRSIDLNLSLFFLINYSNHWTTLGLYTGSYLNIYIKIFIILAFFTCLFLSKYSTSSSYIISHKIYSFNLTLRIWNSILKINRYAETHRLVSSGLTIIVGATSLNNKDKSDIFLFLARDSMPLTKFLLN